jgi:hypothetical protein
VEFIRFTGFEYKYSEKRISKYRKVHETTKIDDAIEIKVNMTFQ